MANYFDMGGYAGYVWPSYAVAAIVLVALFVVTWRGLKTRERTLEMLQAARGGRRRRREGAPEAQAGPVVPGPQADPVVKEETTP